MEEEEVGHLLWVVRVLLFFFLDLSLIEINTVWRTDN